MPIRTPDGWDAFLESDHRVTYHYSLLGMWGTSHQELTVNVPMLKGLGNETGAYGLELWKALIAPATSTTTLLTGVLWSTSPGFGSWFPVPMQPTPGQLGGLAADRNESACITFDHPNVDRWGSKPFFLPGFPSRLTSGGLITGVGLRLLERVCHVMVMGLTDTNPVGTGELYQRWPAENDNGQPVPGLSSFRRVTGFRVMHHTARAPDFRGPL